MKFAKFKKKFIEYFSNISLNFFQKKLVFFALGVSVLTVFAGYSIIKTFSNSYRSKHANNQNIDKIEKHLIWEQKSYSWHINKDEETVNFFDLFSPPNIFKKNDRVIYEKGEQEIIFGTFPIKLTNIQKKLYRVQFEGYVDLSIKKAGDKSTILLFDVEKQESIKCSEGAEFEERGFSVKYFVFEQRESNGTRITKPIVVINDSREGRLVELTNEPELYDDQFIVTFQDLLGRSFVFADIGQTLNVGDAKCRLDWFDYEKRSAKVTLTDVDGQNFVKELFIDN